MKDFKESGLYFLLAIIAAAGALLIMFLIPPEIVNAAFCIFLGIGVFVLFGFILFLFNRFIKYSNVKGGYSFDDYLNGKH